MFDSKGSEQSGEQAGEETQRGQLNLWEAFPSRCHEPGEPSGVCNRFRRSSLRVRVRVIGNHQEGKITTDCTNNNNHNNSNV